MWLLSFDTFGIGASMDTECSVKPKVLCQPIALQHQWRISNFSKYLQNNIKFIESTIFSSYSSKEKFFLRLYPKGYETDQSDYVSIFVHRGTAENKYEITPLSVECKITIINRNDATNCHTKKFSEKYDSNANFFGFDIFVQSADLFDSKKNLLEDDTLTICCELSICLNTETIVPLPFVISNFTAPWKVKNIHEVENHSASITCLNEYICTHKWTIGEFSTLKNDNPFVPFAIDFPWVSSSSYKKVQFKLKLYPDVKMKQKNEDLNIMKMCLTLKSDEIVDAKVDFKFFLIDTDKKQREVKVARLTLESGSEHEWTDFYDRKVLLDEKKQLLSGLDLILSYEAKISLNHITESVEVPAICILKSLNLKLRHYAESDLVLVFENDFKLYAHRKVLIARSSKFAKDIETNVFKNDKQELCLKITNMSVDAFAEFLRFIYTGYTLGFDKYAFELFNASQTYVLSDLTTKCEEWLSENVLENSALKLLPLMKDYNVETLKNNAIHYFQKKPSNLSNEIFKQLRESNHKLLVEVYPSLDRFIKEDSICDVKLILDDGTVLHAHKAVLASNSVVFAAMFQHDTLEKKLNEIQIPDFDVDICEHLLRFMYTEEILPKLDEKTKFNIFIAADKYDLRELKYLTQRWIYGAMTVDSVIDMLVLADMYAVPELKTKAITFFHENADQVTQTEGFKLLCQNRFDLMAEIYLNIVHISKRKMRSFSEEDISVM